MRLKRALAISSALAALFFCCAGCGEGDEPLGGGYGGNFSFGDEITNDGIPCYTVTVTVGAESYIEYLYEQQNNRLVPPQLPGRRFTGFYQNGTQFFDEEGKQTGVLIEHDIAVTAQWEETGCLLVFDPGAGSMDLSLTRQSFYYDEAITLLPVPTPPVGMKFVGWQNGEEMVSDGERVREEKRRLNLDGYSFTGDEIRLSAKYEPLVLKVKFVSLRPDGVMETFPEIEVEYGTAFDPSWYPALPERTGCEAVGWSLLQGSAIVYQPDVVTEDLTLYAIWKNYRIFRLYYALDEEPQEFKIYEGEEKALPVPQRAGREFTGWYTNRNFTGLPVEYVNYRTSYENFYARWI